ncbi:MAG: glycosyltransferase [Pseudomonadota bacterium]
MPSEPIRIGLGVLCYNEEEGIADLIAGLAQQDVFRDARFLTELLVVPNGCTDKTGDVAAKALERHRDALTMRAGAIAAVKETQEKGKAHAWNWLIHDLLAGRAPYVVLIDADIVFPGTTAIRKLIEGLQANPTLKALSSTPIKDLERKSDLSLTERIIVQGGGTRDNKQGICGQLYAARAEALSDLRLPRGLPVEDGFIAGMLNTDGFRHAPQGQVISRAEGVEHLYESERTIGGLLKHQTRIVVGSAINGHLFDHFRTLPPDRSRIAHVAAKEAQDERWVETLITNERTRLLVPSTFLTKRLQALARIRSLRDLKRLPAIIAGLGLDTICYIQAWRRMRRPDRGLGHW